MLFSFSKTKVGKYKNYVSSAKLENEKLSDQLGKLINDGGLIINDYFDSKKIENF